MDSNKFEPNLESTPEIYVSTIQGALKQKTKVFTVKISAPKEMFILPEALSKYGTFPTVEEFVSTKIRTLVSEYVEKAEGIVARASEMNPSRKTK